MVRIDLQTRRPVQAPPEEIAAFKKLTKDPPRPKIEVKLPATIPETQRVFRFSVRALPSDTDRNKHVNQSVCFKYCVNCASLAAMEGGYLRRFTKDIDYYNIKKFSVEYVGEMMVGNVVDVFCWQDTEKDCRLFFILKVGERVTNRCVGEWQTNADGSLVESSISHKLISAC